MGCSSRAGAVTESITEQGRSETMSETKIDFVPQTYPLYVPVMRHLPWLPPPEGEGLWQANLAKLGDEALADEISGLLSVYPVIGWRVSPEAVVPVTPADPLDYHDHDLAEYIRESAEDVRAAIVARYRTERDYAQTLWR
jgi:hypothetical protein